MYLSKNAITEKLILRLLKFKICNILFLPVDDLHLIYSSPEFREFFIANFPSDVTKIVIQYPGKIFDIEKPNLKSLEKIREAVVNLNKLNIPVFYGSMYDMDADYIRQQVGIDNIPLFEIYYSFVRYSKFYEFDSNEILYDIDHGTSVLIYEKFYRRDADNNIIYDVNHGTSLIMDNKIQLLMPCIRNLLRHNPALRIVFSQKLKNKITQKTIDCIGDDRIKLFNLEQSDYVQNIICKSKVSITGSISESGPRLFLFSMMFGKCTYFHRSYPDINGNLLIDEFKPYQRFFDLDTKELDYSKLEPVTYEKILEIIGRYS